MAKNFEAKRIERTSRWGAVVALVVSAGFFGWYGVETSRVWPAVLPFFGGFVAAWLIAGLGVARQRWWAPAFTVGLSVLTLSLLAPAASHLEVALFLVLQLGMLGALGLRAMAEKELGPRSDDEHTWRHGALALSGGLALPWLLTAGLLPAAGAPWIGLTGLALAIIGMTASFRGRTWGLLGTVAAIPVLIAVPETTWGCTNAPHDVAGEIAAVTLGAGLLAWVSPVLASLQRR